MDYNFSDDEDYSDMPDLISFADLHLEDNVLQETNIQKPKSYMFRAISDNNIYSNNTSDNSKYNEYDYDNDYNNDFYYDNNDNDNNDNNDNNNENKRCSSEPVNFFSNKRSKFNEYELYDDELYDDSNCNSYNDMIVIKNNHLFTYDELLLSKENRLIILEKLCKSFDGKNSINDDNSCPIMFCKCGRN